MALNSSKIAHISTLLLVATLISCSHSLENERPNIVWIIAEDLSQDLGVYGNELVDTPNLDQLAQRGSKFTNTFTTATVCTPSRTALATGMYQTSIGLHHMGYPDELKPELPDNINTIHQLFRNGGYATASIKDEPGTGKTHWAFKTDMDQNFDYNHWNDLLSQDKPFFAQVSISNTHRYFPEVDSNSSIIDKITPPPYYPNNKVVRKDWAGYYKSINILDNKVGQIINLIKENNIDQNTIIIFFSDHGRPMTRGKYWNYDSGIRVPMIIYIPEYIKKSNEYNLRGAENQLISLIDIAATTLSMGGIQTPNILQGRIFLGKDKDPERKFVFSASDRIQELAFKSRAVRSKHYKYIRNYNNNFSINSASTAYRKDRHPIYHVLNILQEEGKLTPEQEKLVQSLPKEELYDLNEDPYETYNLVSDPDYKETLQVHREQLENWIRSTGDKGMNPDSKEIISAFNEFEEETYNRFQDQIQEFEEKIRIQLKEE